MKATFDGNNLKKGMTEYLAKVEAGLSIYGETVAKDFESYAKENRPWTDRTTRARQGLTGYTEKESVGSINICIAHTVDYGPFLEYAHEKRYAILEPTVRLKGPEALNGLRGMLAAIKVF